MITIPVTRITITTSTMRETIAIIYIPLILIATYVVFHYLYEYNQLDGLHNWLNDEHTTLKAITQDILKCLVVLALMAGAIEAGVGAGLFDSSQYQKNMYSVSDSQCEEFTDWVLHQRKLTVVSDESCNTDTIAEGKPDTWYTTIDRRVNVTRKEDSNTVIRMRVRIKVPNSPSGRSTVSVTRDKSIPDDTDHMTVGDIVFLTLCILTLIGVVITILAAMFH